MTTAREKKGAQCGYSPFAPTSPLPGASTSPPPLRNDGVYQGRLRVSDVRVLGRDHPALGEALELLGIAPGR
jgi:hypothetical protein